MTPTPVVEETLVSIIINNYNYATYVSDAIESALGQTYSNVEVIVVDDGSEDESMTVISGYGERVTAVFKENGGQGSALNEGFAASHGQLVMFLDADDVLLPRAVECVVAKWREGDAKLQFRLRLCDTTLSPLPLTMPRQTLPMPSGDVTKELLQKLEYTTPPMSGNAFARSFLVAVLPMPVETWRRGADAFLNLTAPLYGTINSVDEELGMYRQHGGNGSARSAAFSPKTVDVFFRDRVLRASRKEPLVLEKAKLQGYQVEGSPMSRNAEALSQRLFSLRLNGSDHPVASDRRVDLLFRSLNAEWRYSGHSARWKIFTSLWLLAGSFLPAPVVRRLVPQLYMSQSRPKWASRLLGKVKKPASTNASSNTASREFQSPSQP